ncbi:hypothetical protein EON64_18955, partial [archaeon]
MSIRQVLQQGLHWASKIYEHRQVLVERFDVGGGDSIISDPSWLQENFLCLLSNGLKYSEAGPVKVRITKQKETVHGDFPVIDSPFLNLRNKTKTASRTAKNSTTKKDLIVSAGAFSLKSIRERSEGLDIEEGSLDPEVHEGVREDDNSSDPSNPPYLLDMLRVEVEDYGMAMTEEVARNLFCPPANSDERSMGGTGLGLYCVSERVKAMNGRYGVILCQVHSYSSLSEDSVNDISCVNLSYRTTAGLEGCRGTVVWFSIPFQVASPASSYGSSDMTELTRSVRRGSKPEDMLREAMMLIKVSEEGSRNEEFSPARSIPESGDYHDSYGIGILSPDLRSQSRVGKPFWDLDKLLPYPRSDTLFKLDSEIVEGKSQPDQPTLATISKPTDVTKARSVSADFYEEKSAVESEGVQASLPPPTSLAASSAGAVNVAATMAPPLKVLIVDDSGLILKVLKATLQKRGHDVSVTTNGYEAL